MRAKKIEKKLYQALLRNGEMDSDLYDFGLIEELEDLKLSLEEDQEDFLFSLIENQGRVAMILIEKSGKVYRNEQARERLQALWSAGYERNIQPLIPGFAQQISIKELPIYGVKIHGNPR